ncbi:MAG: CoA transferase [Gammaproteobacteria bacterium]|nr:CoA transferase [Gammaproteobacteria bacterium]
MKALSGILVVDISRVLAGPYCGQLLADMGADVIKVESPEGDENRRWVPHMADGESSNFMSVNRGKRGITLDLKSPDGQALLRRLVEKADVVIQSFRQGTALRLGVDYESLKAINPDVIACSVNGYGGKGPLADRAGYDLMVQAFSGIMSTTGEEGRSPVRIGVSLNDMSTGLIAYGGILSALYARRDGAGGQHVQVSLLQSAVSLLGYHGVGWLQNGVVPRPEGTGSWHLVPYQAFECRDGRFLVGAPNDGAFRRLCEVIGRQDLAADPRFRTNADRLANKAVLIELLEATFADGDRDTWVDRLDAAGVAAAPLHTVDQAMSHPQVLANDLVVDVERPDGTPLKLLGMPFALSGTPGSPSGHPPRLGEHTEEVLREVLGVDEQEIARLRAAKAI